MDPKDSVVINNKVALYIESLFLYQNLKSLVLSEWYASPGHFSHIKVLTNLTNQTRLICLIHV